jgi:hypothetical protein
MGVLPPSAIAPGGTFTEESTYYFNGEVRKNGSKHRHRKTEGS